MPLSSWKIQRLDRLGSKRSEKQEKMTPKRTAAVGLPRSKQPRGVDETLSVDSTFPQIPFILPQIHQGTRDKTRRH